MRNRTDEMTPATPAGGSLDSRRSIPLWVKLVVIAGALLSAMGGVLALIKPAMMAAPGDAINGAVHIYAGYFAARSFAVALMLLVLLGLRAWRGLGHLMLLFALIQLFDACMDCAEARWSILPGVLVLGFLFALVANRLSGSPLWKLAAWRD
jgi:hypothetical protein